MCTAHSLPWGGGLPGRDPLDREPPVNRITDRCKNNTFPQTSFAGSNYMTLGSRPLCPFAFTVVTSMHSSRMHIVHCSSHLLGGCVCPGGCLPQCMLGYPPPHPTPPPPHGQNSSHTLVKTLYFRNFVCGR